MDNIQPPVAMCRTISRHEKPTKPRMLSSSLSGAPTQMFRRRSPWLSAGADRHAARAGLAALPGIGPWTVEMVAMRALGDPDAFPATDLGVVRGAAALGITDLGRAAEAWRPWRAYAVQHLWAAHDHPINRIPTEESS